MNLSVKLDRERFEIAGGFAISRASRTHAEVLVVTLNDGSVRGHGECVPYARYGESLDSVADQIRAITPAIEAGMSRAQLQEAMPAGAARNAVDCAFWDLEAKTTGRTAAEIAGLNALQPVTTAYTISVGTADAMGEAARKAAARPLLKVKLAGRGDPERLRAVRAHAPDARLIIDANEAWDEGCFAENMAACLETGVELIEQPLPASDDSALERLARPVTVCADESLHTRKELGALRKRYDAVNIKLDKAGGLTEALLLLEAARAHGFRTMIGCMLGTSLAMAPALLLAQSTDYVDLDGPLLLSQDREPGLKFEGSLLYPPEPALWG